MTFSLGFRIEFTCLSLSITLSQGKIHNLEEKKKLWATMKQIKITIKTIQKL